MKQETLEKISPVRELDKAALLETVCRELMTYGVWDRKTKLKNCVRKYVLGRKIPPQDPVFWTTGILAAGLWQYRQELAGDAAGQAEAGGAGCDRDAGRCDQNAAAAGCDRDAAKYDRGAGSARIGKIDAALCAYYERWMGKGCPIACPDDLLAGETLLSMYEYYCAVGWHGQTEESTCRDALTKLADYMLAAPTDEQGSFLYRAAQKNGYIFADTIGLVCPFLYRYGTVFDRPEAREAAVRQIVHFLTYGMDGASGLPYHGYALRDGCKYGIIGWGRAAGWLLRGMGGCMMDQKGVEALKDACTALADAVLAYQRGDGYFSWQLQAADGPADTSATGMICAALRQGIEGGILAGDKYEKALAAGRHAIAGSVRDGRVYDCLSECEGFGQYPQRYGAYPWASGPALML